MSDQETTLVPATESDLSGPVADADGRRSTSLYRAMWRWHFYAGLFAIPVIVMLSLTGIVYLFRPQLDSVLYGALRDVRPGASVVDYQQQLDAVTERFPDGSVDAVMPPHEADRSTQFEVTAEDGTPYSAYVNPYTGDYLGSRNHHHDPSYIALQLHGSLWSGVWLGWVPGGVDPAKWGDWYIELVACWTVVLVVSGVYLWWPRGKRKRRRDGVIVPRWNARNRRVRWRDVHAITGVLFSFVTLFFLISGLAWTGFWGPQVLTRAMDVTNGNYPAALLEGATSTKAGDLTTGFKPGWASSNLPVPLSGEPGSPVQHAGHHRVGTLTWDPSQGAPLDAVVTTAQQQYQPGFAIFMPADETGVYTVFAGPDVDPKPVQRAGQGGTMFIDQYTAQPVANLPESSYAFGARALDWSISVHEGREWGWISQTLTLFGTLALLLSVATSLVMWRARRPKGLGAPRKEPNRKRMLGVVVITLGLGVLFPLLGLSIVVLLLLEYLLIRRVPRLSRTFGMQ
jgi:uncharacterized iron-regulated membrane protein